MTILSVNVTDKTIVMDGLALQFDFDFFPSKLRAIQWNGASGTMEFKTGPVLWFDNPAQVQDYIDQFNAEKSRLEAAEVGAE